MKKKAKTGKGRTLGSRIREIRGKLTQTDFSEAVAIKQAMVSRYEADKETPSPKILLRIAKFSNKSIEWLLTGRDIFAPDDKSTAVSESERVEDHIDSAARVLHDSKVPEAKEFTEMIKGLFRNRNHRLQALKYYRFLTSDYKPEAKKGAHK